MVLKEKDILKIKESIEKFNDFSSKEKDALSDTIELLWLNAGIQKKKKDLKVPESSNEHIIRIRQLLAAAWSEDLNE